MSIFVTSDTHYHHKRILEFTKRPFSTIEEMREGLISRWNERVSRSDLVYHLGDFSFSKDPLEWDKILSRLNGQKHLIRGNHDHSVVVKKVKGFQKIDYYKEIQVEKQRIVMFHYACSEWSRSNHGSIQLFGHSHGSFKVPEDRRQMDVGVDVQNCYPISIEEVIKRMQKIEVKPSDYHGREDYYVPVRNV